MKQLVTTGIVLSRTDYGEADRIITLLTPDHGKLRLMARGVRRVKSRMAGGIELFSVSDITYMRGRGDLGTLISARLIKHYSNVVHGLDRVQLGYELIKLINKVTEDQPEEDYFELIKQAFVALDDLDIPADLINVWFQAQLLSLAGYTPNLLTDSEGNELNSQNKYNFDTQSVAFSVAMKGKFTADQIKVLRLLFSNNSPKILNNIAGLSNHVEAVKPIISSQFLNHFS